MGNKTSKINFHNFGLIGKRLDYSFSKPYFEAKFRLLNLPQFAYDNIECADDQALARFMEKQVYQYRGLNVTIPYKEKILSYLDALDISAQKVNAVNTILNNKGKLIGYNTDVYGFKKALQALLNIPITKALIFGAGGASKAVSYALQEMGIKGDFVSRSPGLSALTYNDLTSEIIRSYPLLINCTPVGTYPDVDKIIPIPIEAVGSDHLVFDLIYNPEETLLLKEAKRRGALISNGKAMLENQADSAWKIWTDTY